VVHLETWVDFPSSHNVQPRVGQTPFSPRRMSGAHHQQERAHHSQTGGDDQLGSRRQRVVPQRVRQPSAGSQHVVNERDDPGDRQEGLL
jgi:hypothetical protein